MTDFLIKSIIAVGLVAASSVAFLSMMALMGRMDKKTDSSKLRRIHRTAGFAFIIGLVPLVYFGLRFLAGMGDALPTRGVIHAYLAFTLLGIFFLKILIVRVYRQFLRAAPGLGMTVFLLTIIMVFMTAGVYFLRSVSGGTRVESDAGVSSPVQPGRPSEGEILFRKNCQSCHSLADEVQGIGPSLKGIFRKETLPSSGRASVPPNIIRQLRAPVGTMPAFPQLTEEEIADLLAYLINL